MATTCYANCQRDRKGIFWQYLSDYDIETAKIGTNHSKTGDFLEILSQQLLIFIRLRILNEAICQNYGIRIFMSSSQLI